MNLHGLKAATRPSTWRVYQFRHQRAMRVYRGVYCRTWKSATELRTNSVPTTTVNRVRLRSTMCVPPGRRREAHAAEAGVAPGVHEDERDQAGGEQYLDDGE